MNDGGHQAQHSACALKTLQRGPVFIQSVKYFRVYGITGQQTVSVLHFSDFQRKICWIFPVQSAEMAAYHFACGRIFAIQKKPAAYHFKTFTGSHGLPDGFHAAKGMFNGFQCGFTSFPAHLYIRFRDGSHHQAAFTGPRGFGYFLYERNEIVETSCRKSVYAIDSFGIGHELIHENKAGATCIEQTFQGFRAWRDPFFIRFLNDIVKSGIPC